MYFVLVLVLLLLVFLIFVGSQSAPVQKRRKPRNGFSQDAGSELSILSIGPTQDIPPALSVPEATYVDASISNYASDNIGSVVSVDNVDHGSSGDFGGALGSALADGIDGGGSSGAFDSGTFAAANALSSEAAIFNAGTRSADLSAARVASKIAR